MKGPLSSARESRDGFGGVSKNFKFSSVVEPLGVIGYAESSEAGRSGDVLNWIVRRNPPQPNQHCMVAYGDDAFVIVGGTISGDSVEIYNVTTAEWTSLPGTLSYRDS